MKNTTRAVKVCYQLHRNAGTFELKTNEYNGYIKTFKTVIWENCKCKYNHLYYKNNFDLFEVYKGSI